MAIAKTTLPIAAHDDSGFFSGYDDTSAKTPPAPASASQASASPEVIDLTSSSPGALAQSQSTSSTAALAPVQAPSRPTQPPFGTMQAQLRPIYTSLTPHNPYSFDGPTEWDRPLRSAGARAAELKACKDLEDSVRQPVGFPVRLLEGTIERVMREYREREERMRVGDEMRRRKIVEEEDERMMKEANGGKRVGGGGKKRKIEVFEDEEIEDIEGEKCGERRKIEVFADRETEAGVDVAGSADATEATAVSNDDMRRLISAVKALREKSSNPQATGPKTEVVRKKGGKKGPTKTPKIGVAKQQNVEAPKKKKKPTNSKVAGGRVDKRGRTRAAKKKMVGTKTDQNENENEMEVD